MTIEMLKGKIHRAVVTDADIDYEGSVSIDPVLMAAAHIREYEKVDVLNITNGERLTTYTMSGGRGEVCLNGAAARLVQKGDRVIIAAYVQLTQEEADHFLPAVVLVDEHNRIIRASR